MGDDPGLRRIAERALDYVRDGEVIGLGTGRAATAFVRALGERVAQGLRVTGVPTSESTAALARELHIPLAELAGVEEIETTFDGADEIDPRLDMIKGYGGAMVREKIVAASSRRRVMLIGEEKLVDRIGARGKLPVEVVPFGLALCRKRIAALGAKPELRGGDAKPYVTDNGNYILDCGIGPIEDPQGFELALISIPGVLGTGLFLGMADVVLVQIGDEVQVRERPRVA
jgi:ribose 5-phosphate isomerase A